MRNLSGRGDREKDQYPVLLSRPFLTSSYLLPAVIHNVDNEKLNLQSSKED